MWGLTPGWPDDPETVAEARDHPEVFAGKGISEIADYEEAIIRRLDRKPVIIGHSFGGLLTMILAGRGARRRLGRDQPCSIPRRAPASDLGAARRQRGPAQSRELEPRRPAHLRAVPLQFRKRSRRGRGEGTVPWVLRPRRRRAALPGGVRESQSVDRGEGQHDELGPGSYGRKE